MKLDYRSRTGVLARRTTWLLLAMLAAFLGATSPLAAAEPPSLEFRAGDRIVLLGGTFIERMQNHGYLEAAITAAYPQRNLTFRNLGWSGDTVWGDSRGVFGSRADGFKRLLADVKLSQPTVIVLCYGANEAHAGRAGLDDFRAGLNTLLTSLEATGARLILLGPHQHENLGPPLPDPQAYNADLRQYNDAQAAIAKERGHAFVDLYDLLAKSYGQNSSQRWTENGLHLREAGEVALAQALLPLLGVPVWNGELTLDAGAKSAEAPGIGLSDVAWKNDGASFTATLRPPVLPCLRVGSGAATVNLGNCIRLRVKGLPDGNYELLADGTKVASGDAKTLAAGIVVSPNAAAGDKLRQTINAKNELFFYRYRPQNETYLFLFRKHEQGNNAVEIPQFDPLIAAKEAEIARLKQPTAQRFELKKVGQ